MHFLKTMHACCGFLRNAAPILDDLVPAIGILTMNFQQQIFDDLFFLVRRFGFCPIAAFLELVAFGNEQRCVTAVIDYKLRPFAVWMRNRAISAPPVIFKRFAFPSEHGYTTFGDGCGSVILRRE